MTLRDYYKHFVSLYGTITAAIGGIPLLSFFLPSDYSRCLLPPIGPPQDTLRIALPLIAVMVTFIVYQTKDFVKNKSRFRYLRSLTLLALISFIIYIGLNIRFVHTIDNRPEPNVTVSVGYNRSDAVLNKKNERGEYVFAGKTDKELIQSEGGTGPVVEGSIDKLWTPWSIFLVRSALFLSYFFCFLPFIGIGSFLIL